MSTGTREDREVCQRSITLCLVLPTLIVFVLGCAVRDERSSEMRAVYADLRSLDYALQVYYIDCDPIVRPLSSRDRSFVEKAVQFGVERQVAEAMAKRPWVYKTIESVTGKDFTRLQGSVFYLEARSEQGRVLGRVRVDSVIVIEYDK